jgi:Family of unknown function (DUF6152)
MIPRWGTLLLVAAALAAPAAGHHSVRATYDPARPVTVTGTLTGVQWRNPHAWLELRVTGEDASDAFRRIEMSGPGNLVREGIDPGLFRIGQVLSVEAWLPREDAADPDALGLAGITVTLPDGRRLDVHDRWGDSVPAGN